MFDRFRDVVVEPGARGVVDLVHHGIRRERHDGDLGEVVSLLPGPDLLTRVVAVFDGHLDVALQMSVSTRRR